MLALARRCAFQGTRALARPLARSEAPTLPRMLPAAPPAHRAMSTGHPAHLRIVEMFSDPYDTDSTLAPPGRRWRAAEIRLKSNEDLQKLWIVLLRERNMLHTTKLMHKKRGSEMEYPERLKRVRKSMAMIKVVLCERERERRAREAAELEEDDHQDAAQSDGHEQTAKAEL